MSKTSEHKNLIIPTVNDTVEVFFNQSGTDVTTNPYIWYFDLSKAAKAIFIQSDQICQIVEINGETLKTPKNIEANGYFSHNVQPYQEHKYTQIKIKVLTANSNIQVFGSC